MSEDDRHHKPKPPPPQSNPGLVGFPNVLKIMVLAYLASLAVSLHLINNSVNITNLSKK